MRKDMSKVIVERSRIGGNRASKGRMKSASFDSLPNKESMKKRHSDRKVLNENLNPLKRFLKAQVGRPWDKIYSEICENLKVTSAVQQHVKDHLWDFVYKNVTIQDKKVFSMRRYYGKLFELRNQDMYICPNSGVLKLYKIKKEKRVAYDYFQDSLSAITDGRSKLIIEGNIPYKIYQDKKTKLWDKKNEASKVHAKNDFESRSFSNLDQLQRFFNTYHKKLNLKHPYWATYFELVKEATENKKRENRKRSHLAPGTTVEFSKDDGKTWKVGIINRLEVYDNGREPIYWVTSDNKNIMVSNIITRALIKPKGND